MITVEQKREILDQLVSAEQIADRIGVQISTFHIYMRRARVNRAAGRPRPADLPAPDLQTPRCPMWLAGVRR